MAQVQCLTSAFATISSRGDRLVSKAASRSPAQRGSAKIFAKARFGSAVCDHRSLAPAQRELKTSRAVVCEARGRRGSKADKGKKQEEVNFGFDEDGEEVVEVKSKAEELKETVEAKAEEVKEAVEAKAEEVKEAVEAKAEAVAAEAEEVKEAVEAKVEEVKEEIEAKAAEEVKEEEPVATEESTEGSVEYDYDFGDYEDTLATSDLKNILLDSVVSTNRGFDASSELRAEVNELITQLEAVNPTASPTDEADLIGGSWRLAYTSNSELSLFLAANRLPLLEVGDILQIIDVESGKVENKIEIITPLARQSFSATADFEVQSPKRLQIKFVEGKLFTPTLVEDLPIPDKIDLGGNSIDISGLQEVASKLQTALQPAIKQASALLKEAPDVTLPLAGSAINGAESWLLTTYLDEDLRIARGDAGSVFVLTKEPMSSA